jgi:hypothetical protein
MKYLLSQFHGEGVPSLKNKLEKTVSPGTCFLAVLLVLLFAGPTSAQHTILDENCVSHTLVRIYKFSVLGGAYVGTGAYANITKQPGDTVKVPKITTGALTGGLEIGVGFLSFGVIYDVDGLTSRQSYSDTNGVASQILQRIRGVYQISYRSTQIVPEVGYVYRHEWVDTWRLLENGRIPYNRGYKDENYSYGLTLRRDVSGEGGLWLYGRYVHDNTDIMVDSYWLGIEIGGTIDEFPKNDKWKPCAKSVHFGLIYSWAKRTDGRVDGFVSLLVDFAVGML